MGYQRPSRTAHAFPRENTLSSPIMRCLNQPAGTHVRVRFRHGGRRVVRVRLAGDVAGLWAVVRSPNCPFRDKPREVGIGRLLSPVSLKQKDVASGGSVYYLLYVSAFGLELFGFTVVWCNPILDARPDGAGFFNRSCSKRKLPQVQVRLLD